MLVETIAPGFPVSVGASPIVDAKVIRFVDGIGIKLEMANENFVIVRSDIADDLIARGVVPRGTCNQRVRCAPPAHFRAKNRPLSR